MSHFMRLLAAQLPKIILIALGLVAVCSQQVSADPIFIPGRDATEYLSFDIPLLLFGILLPFVGEYFTLKFMLARLIALPEKMKKHFIIANILSYPTAILIFYALLFLGKNFAQELHIRGIVGPVVFVLAILIAEVAAIRIEKWHYDGFYIDLEEYGMKGWWPVIVANAVSFVIGALGLTISGAILSTFVPNWN